MAVFGYGRVSTVIQNTTNQRLELEQAGLKIDYWFEDAGVSGKTCASQRPAFKKLLEKIRDEETLIVSKIDRLGRDAVDVLQTVQMLASRQIKVIVHQLGQTDLTSPAGKLLLTMLVAVAAMERDLLIERTQAGLQRARAEGKRLGRPRKTNDAQRDQIRELLAKGISVSDVARMSQLSRASVISIRDSGVAN
jgi:putative DNA-invertase from lambdoid prophage Rac